MLTFSSPGDWSDLRGSGGFQYSLPILTTMPPSWLVTVGACAGRQAARVASRQKQGESPTLLCLLKPEQVFNFNYPKKKEKNKQKRCDNAFSCCWWCCCLVAKSYPTVCNPMYCRTSGSSFLYYLLEFAQINVH